MAPNPKLQLLSIGELSAETGCPTGTIRYYERLGVLNTPPRTGSGRRVYTGVHLRQLRFALRARALGFSLDRIRQLSELADAVDRPRPQAWAITQAHLREVEGRIVELRALAARLSELIDRAPPDGILAFLTGKADAGSPPSR